MRTITVSLLFLAACGNDDPARHLDASIAVADAPPSLDAAVDALPDAPNMDVVTACMHLCDAIGACVMEPAELECYADCQTDLADCTAQQVATLDACSTETCGDLEGNMSPLLTCITSVSCVEMAVAFPRE